MKNQQSDIEREAISIVRDEKTQWETATAFITEKVAFNMRELIRLMRKNYWGVFDTPKDPITKRDKIWVPLTEYFVDSAVKNVDLDTKDINFRAKKPSATGLSTLVKAVTKCQLDEDGFGEDLDDLIRRMAIDGTSVWKTIPVTEDGKKVPKRVNVDLLNIYIDPTARSIQEAYRFTERSLMTEQEVRAMSGWINTEGIEGTLGLPKTDSQYTTEQGTTKLVDVWEMWGKGPKSLITGKQKDTEEVDLHIIVSGLDGGGKARVHLIETYKGFKPYEEAWYIRVPGRWYGKGIAEKLMWLQLWINTVVNVRINRAMVSQLGIFVARRGAGITAQMLSKMAANGVIVTNDPSDIQQLRVQEASEASYKDEDVIHSWGQRTTSAFDVVTGEQLPSSTPATNAAIQARNAQSAFGLIKEGIGMFLQRYLKRHYIPIIFKNIKLSDIIRVSESSDSLRELDEKLANVYLYDALDRMPPGTFFDPMQVEQERQRILAQLSNQGTNRYFELFDELDPTLYDVQVYVTNEEFDKSVMLQDLISMLNVAPEFRGQIIREAFDLMGLTFRAPEMTPMMPGAPGTPGQPGSTEQSGALPAPGQSMQQLVTSANTLNGGQAQAR